MILDNPGCFQVRFFFGFAQSFKCAQTMSSLKFLCFVQNDMEWQQKPVIIMMWWKRSHNFQNIFTRKRKGDWYYGDRWKRVLSWLWQHLPISPKRYKYTNTLTNTQIHNDNRSQPVSVTAQVSPQMGGGHIPGVTQPANRVAVKLANHIAHHFCPSQSQSL